mgnify:CR=1 FL=1
MNDDEPADDEPVGMANPASVYCEEQGGTLDIRTDADGHPLSALAIVSLLGWGLGYFGQPHVLARFMAASSAERIPASRRIAMTFMIGKMPVSRQ